MDMDKEDEKLIALVKCREILYNPKHKDHHNRGMVDNLWTEVSEEMDMSVNEVKVKWTSFRNSYARHLRNQSRPSAKKTKWYLADQLQFLNDCMNPKTRKQKASKNKAAEQEEEAEEENDSDSTEVEPVKIKVEPDIVKEEPSSETENSVQPDLSRVKKEPVKVEDVFGPMVDYLRNEELRRNEEHPLICFAKSLLPEYNALVPDRQWIFKKTVLDSLFELTKQQEMDLFLP